jgi:hypothetical protein
MAEGGDREERIRHRAYELWQEAGRPVGRAEEFWRLARWELEADDDKSEPDEGEK